MDRACVLGMPANLAKDAVSLNGKMILLRARTSSRPLCLVRKANEQNQERHLKPSLALLKSFLLSANLRRLKSGHWRMNPRILHPPRKSRCRHEVTCTISIIYAICYKCNKMYKYPSGPPSMAVLTNFRPFPSTLCPPLKQSLLHAHQSHHQPFPMDSSHLPISILCP